MCTGLMGRCPLAVLCCQDTIKQLNSPGEQCSASPLVLKAGLDLPVPGWFVHLTCCGVVAKTGHRVDGWGEGSHHVLHLRNVSAVKASMRLMRRKKLLGDPCPALCCFSSMVSQYSAGRRGLEILLVLTGARISALHKTSEWVSSMALRLPP